MISRFLVCVFTSVILFLPTLSVAKPIKVVTSFSVLNDLVQEVGGEHIRLTNLVSANGDAHVYQPSVRDAQAVAQADLLVVNGLGFEGWLERLEQASGFSGLKIAVSDGVDLISLDDSDEQHEGDEHHEEHHEDEHHHDGFDPHAWHSVTNVLVYVENIRNALIEVSPENTADFNQNAHVYVQKLKQLEQNLKIKMASVPANKRNVITSHDAFGYLAREYGFHFTAPQGMSTEAEASAADVVTIITQIRQQNIQAVFVEKVSDSRLIEQIARETGVQVGGELYADALSESKQGAGTYIDMMQHNISTLVQALRH
jgi:zinc/manganese transport system substrate-binding protein